MHNLIPEAKFVQEFAGAEREFSRLHFQLPDPRYERVVRAKLWDLPSLGCSFGAPGSEPGTLQVLAKQGLSVATAPEGLDAEKFRKRLLEDEGMGVISIDSTDIRIAFSSVEEENIEELFNAMLKCAVNMNKNS